MSKVLLFAASMLLMSTIAVKAQNDIQSIEIGTTIPMADKTVKTVNNGDVKLQDVKTDKGLLVMFSCNTCPYVIKSQARTKEMMAYAKSKGLGMVIINSNEAKRDGDDSDKAMAKYAKKERYTVPYLVDENSAIANAFGATRTPEVFLFDANGNLVYKGAMEDNPSNPSESEHLYLKNAIDNMLSNVAITPNTTKSIGCGIKRAS